MRNGVTGKLNVGDIIHVGNPLRKEQYCYYPVTAIEGNKAKTGFRDFHVSIYFEKYIYEYGKRTSGVYDNSYTISDEESAHKAGATI